MLNVEPTPRLLCADVCRTEEEQQTEKPTSVVFPAIQLKHYIVLHTMTTYADYKHLLIHAPERQWDADPDVLIDRTTSSAVPTFSLVMPIHNQETVIANVLSSVVLHTVGAYELCLILDGCTDSTKSNVLKWIDATQFPSACVRLLVLENKQGIFETSCDNQGFVLARGKYIVEIQADMVILTFGYNLLLATPLEVYPDMIAVSGRCCHGLNTLTQSLSVGKIGTLVSHPHPATFDTDTVYLSHTVNRGPLVLRREMLHTLGYLDEEHYVLGDDEHDLFMRAWTTYQWRTGFVPVEVWSPLEWGSTRKEKSPEVRQYLESRQRKEKAGFMGIHRFICMLPAGELRQMTLSDKLAARGRLLSAPSA
jgi:hypothetical protein